jgi:hypothetical protein
MVTIEPAFASGLPTSAPVGINEAFLVNASTELSHDMITRRVPIFVDTVSFMPLRLLPGNYSARVEYLRGGNVTVFATPDCLGMSKKEVFLSLETCTGAAMQVLDEIVTIVRSDIGSRAF